MGGNSRRGSTIAGLVLIGLAGLWLHSKFQFTQTALRAPGVVVEMSEDDETWYPVVEFAPADGAPVRFVSNVGTNPPAFSVGEAVEVLYAPGHPESAAINSLVYFWLGPLLTAGVALALLFGGFRKRRASDGL